MTDAVKLKTVKIIVLVTYLIMIVVNGLANALPINNLSTGEVSDSFPNLFAPTGLTFSIWGLIYLLLAAYTLYQLGLFREKQGKDRNALLVKIGVLFSVSSLVNALWIFSWHYLSIGLSLVLMLILLVLLIVINLQTHREKLTGREAFFIRLPFAVYFGWITVATVANVTALLVFSGWNAFGIAEPTWAVLIIAVGLLIGAVTTYRLGSIAYGLVIIWAYIGIWIKHASAGGFAGSYPAVIVTVIISIVIMAALLVYMVFRGKGKAAAAA